jgi:microcompartment protein CcmL/EutN
MAVPRPSGDSGEALGLLETFGLVAAIEGADAMLKAANVRLLAQERTIPGLITSTVVGETAAVRAAVDAGRVAAERVGKVISAHVIPRPAPEVWDVVGDGKVSAEETKDATPESTAPVAAARRAAVPKKSAPANVRRVEAGRGQAPQAPTDVFESMTVSELRRLARERDDEAFSGRAISRASKGQLLRFLRTGGA